MNQKAVDPLSGSIVSSDDEIDLGALLGRLWKLRALIVGFMIACVALVIAFHMARGTLSSPQRIEYAIALTFAQQSGELRYPGGNLFSPNDLKAPAVLTNVRDALGLDISIDDLSSAISVRSSNSLLESAERQLELMLSEDKTPEGIRKSAESELNNLKLESQRYITISLLLDDLSVSKETGIRLIQAIVDQWVKISTDQGLFNVDSSHPVDLFSIQQSGNLIDIYDNAEKYLNSLSVAVRSISNISGTESLTIEGKNLSDLQRDIETLENSEIGPLREFAYSNSERLASKDPAIQIRLLARQRLLKLESERLNKLIASYDQAIEELATSFNQSDTRRNVDPGQGNLQLDQSVINSLLQMGNQLGAVESRNELFKLRTQTVEKLYSLEKEMAILAGVNDNIYGDLDPANILNESLPYIESQLNVFRAQLDSFILAYREIILNGGSQVFSAQSAPLPRGGYIMSLRKLMMHTVIALVLGLMLGLFVALVRLAVTSARS
jgi:hypothetical protein